MSERRKSAETPDKGHTTDSHDLPTRRAFLTGLLAGAGALLSGCARIRTDAILHWSGPCLQEEYPIDRETYPVIDQGMFSDAKIIQERYGVVLLADRPLDLLITELDKKLDKKLENADKEDDAEVNTKLEDADIEDDKEDIDIFFYINMLRKELALYPPEYLRSCGLKKIMLQIHDIKLRGGRTVSLGANSFRIDLNVSAGFLRNPIHHEIAHVADSNRGYNSYTCFYDWEKIKNATMYSVRRSVKGEAADWVLDWISLNKEGLRAYNPSSCKPSKAYYNYRPAGFASEYGSCNFSEDRAEIAEFLFMQTDDICIEEICKEDPVLAKKVKAYKEDLRRRTNGRMGPQYWEDLHAGKVNEEYWDKH